jgi:glucose-1-phosphate thymidylyltransferase
MKGVILAGGTGTRLRPMTRVVNKHILPVYNEPMIFYPLRTLLNNGIDEILVVSTPDDIGRYITLLEGEFEAEFTYRVQSEPKGIAHALSLAENFASGPLAVILGDNIIRDDLTEDFEKFEKSGNKAQIFLKEVEKTARYGIARLNEGEVTKLVEKPDNPESKKAVIGLYLYDPSVFDIINEIEPSDRGEYEITDVNAIYLRENELDHAFVGGEWFDVGTPEGLFSAAESVRDSEME